LTSKRLFGTRSMISRQQKSISSVTLYQWLNTPKTTCPAFLDGAPEGSGTSLFAV